MRRQGRISEWRDEQGFGFITPNGGGEKIFLHIKAFQPPARRPLGKELVDFHLSSDDKGRPRAERVKYAQVGRTPAPAAAGTRSRASGVSARAKFTRPKNKAAVTTHSPKNANPAPMGCSRALSQA